jgi:hypothetical protein
MAERYKRLFGISNEPSLSLYKAHPKKIMRIPNMIKAVFPIWKGTDAKGTKNKGERKTTT